MKLKNDGYYGFFSLVIYEKEYIVYIQDCGYDATAYLFSIETGECLDCRDLTYNYLGEQVVHFIFQPMGYWVEIEEEITELMDFTGEITTEIYEKIKSEIE